LRKNQQRQ